MLTIWRLTIWRPTYVATPGRHLYYCAHSVPATAEPARDAFVMFFGTKTAVANIVKIFQF